MKALVIFYSRTGTTKIVATAIAQTLHCEMEEIFDLKNRLGVLGYLLAGRDATFKKLTPISPIKQDPSLYDLVIIGTPVWSFTMASAIRSYINNNSQHFKKVAFFCTQGGSGAAKTFQDMSVLCGQEPVTTLELTTKEIFRGNYLPSVQSFITRLTGG